MQPTAHQPDKRAERLSGLAGGAGAIANGWAAGGRQRQRLPSVEPLNQGRQLYSALNRSR
jgi:hypothetical protein